MPVFDHDFFTLCIAMLLFLVTYEMTHCFGLAGHLKVAGFYL